MTDGDNNNRVCFEWHGIMASRYVRTVPLELEGIQLPLYQWQFSTFWLQGEDKLLIV